jgi:deoxyribodipyrimidine photo-lyase
MNSPLQQARARVANDRPINQSGHYVLYWPQMYRRLHANHALDAAIHWSNQLQKPLVVYEGLKLNYPWASARFHQFLLEGMAGNVLSATQIGLNYWPFVETPEAAGRGLVRNLASQACLVITDDYPQFIVPAQIQRIAESVDVQVIAIDGNGMVPLSLLGPPTAAAAHLRPKWHKLFSEAWQNRAVSEPVIPKLGAPKPPFKLWQPPENIGEFVKSLPIDQSVPAVPGVQGGTTSGQKLLSEFVSRKLSRYADERSIPDDPERNSASGLSIHLHYGHISIQEVCEAVLGPEWSTKELNLKTRNKDGFFCDDADVNSFLDEAITWRDVGFQWHYARQRLQEQKGAFPSKSWQEPGETMPSFNFQRHDFSPLDAEGTLKQVLPSWAYASLKAHEADKRTHCYSLEQFERGQTHDALWNAAQRELVATGRMHNYLRMLWGKKVLEWSASVEEAYRTLEHLNNKYALDGRDPNSYTGVLWCFGLFDRPWPPERQIFGNIRYMTSESTAKKFKLAGYHEYVRRLPTIQAVRSGNADAVKQNRLF